MKRIRNRSDRRSYYAFAGLNNASIQLVAPDVITLLSIVLGASPLLIGVINSLSFVTFTVVPFGRLIIPKGAPVHFMVFQWRARYLSLFLVVLALVLSQSSGHTVVILLFFVGLCGFYLGKGFGTAARGPVIGHVSEGSDRGAFLSRAQVISISVQIGMRLTIAGLLSSNSPPSAFIPIVVLAIVVGFGGSVFLQRISEPPPASVPRNPGASRARGAALRLAKAILPILLYVFLWALFTGMALPFFIVFLKTVVHLGDNAIILCSIAGSGGALMAMLAANRWMDQLGPRRFLVGAAGLYVASVLLMLVDTTLRIGISGLLFGSVVFVLFRSAQAVVLAAGDAFLLNSIRPAERLDGGIFYQVVRGVGGIIGSVTGGAVVNALHHVGRLGAEAQFRRFWLLCLAVALLYGAAALGLRGAANEPAPSEAS